MTLEPARFGERVGELGAAFRCAECGEIACVVRMAPAGAVLNMGPTLGDQTYETAGVFLDLFLSSSWHLLDPPAYDEVSRLLSAASPDPLALRQVDWELAPFFCCDCGLNYCRAHWNPMVVYDEGFYDYTEGHCPKGHRQMIDD